MPPLSPVRPPSPTGIQVRTGPVETKCDQQGHIYKYHQSQSFHRSTCYFTCRWDPVLRLVVTGYRSNRVSQGTPGAESGGGSTWKCLPRSYRPHGVRRGTSEVGGTPVEGSLLPLESHEGEGVRGGVWTCSCPPCSMPTRTCCDTHSPGGRGASSRNNPSVHSSRAGQAGVVRKGSGWVKSTFFALDPRGRAGRVEGRVQMSVRVTDGTCGRSRVSSWSIAPAGAAVPVCRPALNPRWRRPVGLTSVGPHVPSHGSPSRFPTCLLFGPASDPSLTIHPPSVQGSGR